MKNYFILICIFSLSISSMSAQFQWEELDAHNQEILEIVFVNNQNKIIGWLENQSTLFISDDYGINWTILYQGEIRSSQVATINQNDSGELFIIIEDDFYKINEDNDSLELYFETGYNPLFDFMFLPNGNIAFVSWSSLFICDLSGEILFIHRFDGSLSKPSFVDGSINNHFISDSGDGLVMFNSDLSEVNEELQKPYFQNIVVGPDGKRLYADSRYTDDGLWWKLYPNEIRGDVILTNDEAIYLIGNDSTYIKPKNEESFIAYENNKPDGFLSNAFAIDDSGFVYSYSDCHKESGYTFDGYSDWVSFNSNDLGLPYAYYVEVASSDNIIISGCDDALYYTTSDNNGWQELTSKYSTDDCKRASDIISTREGVFISSDGCLSDDEGLTWVSTLDIDFYNSKVIYKNESLYLLGSENIYSSTDEGRSWEEHLWDNKDFIINNSFFDLSSTEHIYTYNGLETSYQLTKTSLTGDILNTIPYDGFVYSSFDGPNVYIILFSSDSLDQHMVVSKDEGQTFNIVKLPIDRSIDSNVDLIVDHHENLYLFNKSWVWYSDDEGESWTEITPENPNLISIEDLDVGWDDHIYLATIGTPILKSFNPVSSSAQDNVQENLHNISLYPNPTNSHINIKYADNMKLDSYEIFNLQGMQLGSGSIYNNQIETGQLSSGLYLIKIWLDNGQHFEKLFTKIP